jgi:hypothetical protein
MPLNPSNVPAALVPLLPMAEKWGIGDDFDRENALRNASRQELEGLVHSIDVVSDDDLFGWLSGPESYSPHPSAEYVAFTCLTMAIDSAKTKLKKMM